jgi:hypothetical protein
VSSAVDAKFSAAERERLLAEVREHLPAFLRRDATEQHDPVGDVRQLLNLERDDLAQVTAVHQCLDPAALEFGAALQEGLRRPATSSIRPAEVGQSVCGPIDWAGTTARRAQEGGDPSVFVVRGARRVFDTAENRALVWLLERLTAAVDAAVTWNSRDEIGTGTKKPPADPTWSQRIDGLRRELAEGRRTSWLRAIPPTAPTAATLRSLRAARSAFYAERVAPALESVLQLANPSAEVLTDVLARRYFRPEQTWRLFEIAVALRLARAFAARSPRPRRTRLLVGEGRASFARYAFDDGAEVTLTYQAWPALDRPSMRRRLGKRHGLQWREGVPDIIVVRSGPDPDAVVLELKASHNPDYLREGVDELLVYLADHPGFWARKPSGWLVAPASAAFEDGEADPDLPLWVVSADRVAAAAANRFASSAAG